jgi:hypothetical protein
MTSIKVPVHLFVDREEYNKPILNEIELSILKNYLYI